MFEKKCSRCHPERDEGSRKPRSMLHSEIYAARDSRDPSLSLRMTNRNVPNRF
jgi:hypothetical protein